MKKIIVLTFLAFSSLCCNHTIEQWAYDEESDTYAVPAENVAEILVILDECLEMKRANDALNERTLIGRSKL